MITFNHLDIQQVLPGEILEDSRNQKQESHDMNDLQKECERKGKGKERMLFILVKYFMYNGYYYVYTSDRGGHRGYSKVDLPKQHHLVFGTRWELNPGRGIHIPHRVPLHHGSNK